MKYLKLFGETLDESSSNESNTDVVKQIVKDILLPISDLGYDITVSESSEHSELIIRIVLWSDEPLVITDAVKDEFITMKDYLESEGYNSIKAKFGYRYSILPSSKLRLDLKIDEGGIDDLLNIKYPIENLLFIVKN